MEQKRMKPLAFALAVGVCLTLGVIGALSQSETGGPDTVGPDVITADLYELHHWGANAPGTIHAYSVGTMSCNIGDTPLSWHNYDNQRPVIGQNMFRLRDGRFEQIGQSWLKWAFLALNENFCGTCITPPGGGSQLGVHCSDPYSASLNGSQGGLGPKSVVNPFTGYLPANHATPGSGTINGRLQVHTFDLDPNQNAGALYFVEGQYVSPDDAAAGNLYNNASYRQVWITGAYGITFTNPQGGSSATVRDHPAIEAWKAVDPTVGLKQFDVPGDGRLYLGCKATTGGVMGWHYELAIQNLNCDRAVGAITVLLPSGATAANLGFHDVDYHSGEPYSGTDWPGTITAAGSHWETTAYATDPNANALRWGTIYNFRFDSSAAPTFVTEVELTLFKPGDPASLVVTLDQGPYRLGDLNCDGVVSFDDINPFIEALSDPAGWQSTHPNCPLPNGDTNGDGVVDFDDINAFVALLST
jgi:hypothetical protein